MKIKHHEIEIPQENPFANCKLAREPYARVLSDIVNTYADGFVLAINNEWGTGKTTFVKMWQQQLEDGQFKTIYFNAWENDFDSSPLVAIMSELRTLTKANDEVFKSVLQKGAVLAKNVAPELVKSLLSTYFGLNDSVLNTIKNTTDGVAEILSDEIDKYVNKKKTIVEFREELRKFIEKNCGNKPLVFIIDELDRCRPDYAVEVLEQMKHFFSVPGIVFVLSIDKKHLGSAIKGYYGSEKIDSNEYLRRFIDLEYSIPIPKTKLFIEYLYEYYQFNDFFSSAERSKYTEFHSDGDFLLEIADKLFSKTNSTLRQQERIFALTRLILCSFRSNQYSFSHLLFILVYLKTMQDDIFQKIEKNEYTLQELSDLFYDTIYFETKKSMGGLNLLYVEALLLWLYNNRREYHERVKLIERDESGDLSTPIKSKLENNSSHSSLANCFQSFVHDWSLESTTLDYLINKINLTESVTIQ